MSKELIISSNRHETRVAILEDDQLVEIFYQRQQQYSLAGSIHKGRVTRVLPGMQSAFVDIGLERDAFLYVSDFFEDNEEYDQVVADVEEKVLRLEKGSPAHISGVAPVVEVAPVSSIRAEAGEAVPAPQPGPERFGDRGGKDRDRDRRGRRSRRRRGGRGFPESKYAPQAAAPEPRERSADRGLERTPVDEEELPVLPGESLAKYSRQDSEPGQAALQGEQHAGEELAAHEHIEVEAVTAEPEAAELPAAGRIPVADWVHDAEPAVAVAERTELPRTEPVEVAVAEEMMTAAEAEAEADAAQARAEAEVEVAEAAEVSAETEQPEEGEAFPEEAGIETPREDEVEPSRIPVSLTATLREQGGRYPHRVSRRMRRRMRGGGPAETAEPRGPETQEPAPEPRREGRPEQRQVSRPERPPQPSITDLLREGQEIIVQIAKEPLGQKGARITSYVALPGRYVVYMPTVDHVGVSRKIASDEERHRLKRILQQHRQGMPGGFILRTAGEGKSEEELRSDMMFLYNLWLDIRQKAEKRKAPALIHHDLDVVQRILRDQLTSSYKTVWVDNEELYENVVQFVQRFQPGLVNRVKLYTRSTPIFDAFNITSELEKALRPKVWLKSGGYIVINQTEALVAIDINTGKYVGKSNRLEDTIVKTNTDAIKEIVRQIRLRDLGGIIVVDFIDMDERKNRQKVMQALEEAMRADRAPNKILQFNDFGLVAITRKRVKQSLERTLCSPCPYCEGAGYVKSVGTVIAEILEEAHKIAPALEGRDVVLRVNPEVAKVLKSSKNDYLEELEEILRRTVVVQSDPLLHEEKFDLA